MRAVYFAVLVLAISIAVSAFVNAAYQPPMYVASPETRECQYYFAGESDCFDACMDDCQGAGLNYTNCLEPCANQYCHYNLRPAGFTIDLGATTNFESVNESCDLWNACLDRQGTWDSATAKCEIKKQNMDALAISSMIISVIALILIIIAYIKIRKMLKQIHTERK